LIKEIAMKKRIHIILNAHLDPIWLWPWTAGLDECLATCRSVCDILESDPEPFFSQGEAWVYQQIERTDLALFQRIKSLAMQGRWEITGGWWTQPDCNAPALLGLQRQIKEGKDYFLSRFGRWPETAFNPDSFGHCIGVPETMGEMGQKYYAFMRPQKSEMTLPASIFRWRGKKGGREILAFHIEQSYGYRSLSEDVIRACLAGVPDGVACTACFCGAGDHGGGPTLKLIQQARDLAASMDDVEIVFSTMSRFFSELEPQRALLPEHIGELQFHSIGCYSVMRAVKTGVARAADRLRQAEIALASQDAGAPPYFEDELRKHWQNTVFHQFHDTLGGTCIHSAYRHVINQLGAAEAFAEEEINRALRRKMAALPNDPLQRIVLYNPSDMPFNGWAAVTPWMDMRSWKDEYTLMDEDGKPAQFQCISPECLLCGSHRRLIVNISIPAGGMRILRIVADGSSPRLLPDPEKAGFDGDSHCMENFCGAAVSIYPPEMIAGTWSLALPDPMLFDDLSDTWTHVQPKYGEEPCALPTWGIAKITEDGPYMREICQEGKIGDSRILRQIRIFVDSPDVEMRLRVEWQERSKVLKLVMPITLKGASHLDAVPGGCILRPLNAQEYPVSNWACFPLDGNEKLAIVSPDIYALDANGERIRLTLLRSPKMAHHQPDKGERMDAYWADRGEHEFTIRFKAGEAFTENDLDAIASAMRNPLFKADLTRGMPPLGERR